MSNLKVSVLFQVISLSLVLTLGFFPKSGNTATIVPLDANRDLGSMLEDENPDFSDLDYYVPSQIERKPAVISNTEAASIDAVTTLDAVSPSEGE